MLRVRLSPSLRLPWAPHWPDARVRARCPIVPDVPAAATQVLRFQSVPAGRRVQTAEGQTCRTPCSLAVPVTNQSVSFIEWLRAANDPDRVHQAEGSLFSSPPPDLVPNPVRAMLQAAPAAAARKVVKPSRANRRPTQACRAAPGINAGTDPAIDRRSRAAPAPGQCVSASPADVRLALPAAATDALAQACAQAPCRRKNSGLSGLYPAQ